MTPKKLHEENHQVYKITILKGNYTKYNDHFDGIGKMWNEYSNFKNNFSENFWKYTEIYLISQNWWVKILTENQFQHLHYMTVPNA